MIRKILQTGFVFIVVFLSWYIAALLLSKAFLPGPAETLKALGKLHNSGALWIHTGASLARVFLALVWGFFPAAVLGLSAGRLRRLDAIVSPLAYVFHPLPKAAFLPVIMLFFGLGDGAKVFLIAVIIFTQILVSARDAAKKVPENLLDSVRSLGAGPFSLIVRVIIPGCLPALFTALRVSLGTAIAVLFFSETFATESGLGFLIMDAWTRIAYAEMYAGIVSLSLMGFILFLLCDLAEKNLCPWTE